MTKLFSNPLRNRRAMSQRMLSLAVAAVIATSLFEVSSFAQAPTSAPAQAAATANHTMGNPTVAAAQEALNKEGARLTVDGKAGPKTRAAVRDYQGSHGLKVTGHLDKATLAALNVVFGNPHGRRIHA